MLNVYTRLQAAAGVGIIAVCPGDVSTRMCSGKEFSIYIIKFYKGLGERGDFSEILPDIGSPMLQSPQEAAQDVIWVALNEECMPGWLSHRACPACPSPFPRSPWTCPSALPLHPPPGVRTE